MCKQIFRKNKELEVLNLNERLQYFDELKKYCRTTNCKGQKKFLPRIISVISPHIRNYEFEIRESENIPVSTNVLFVANHSNSHDFFTMQETFNSLNIHLTFLASNEDIGRLIISIFQYCNGILIDRKDQNSIDNGILQFAVNMAHGMSGVIFSESTWNLHPYKPMLPIKVGAAHISAVLEIPVVPVIFEYVEVPYLCTKEKELYSKCIVKFGKPIYISRTENLLTQTYRIQSAMEKIRIGLWEKLGIEKLSLADVKPSLYGNHTWLKKFGTPAEYDSRREAQFILSKNGQPVEDEFCFDESKNLIPGIIEKKEKEKYIGAS